MHRTFAAFLLFAAVSAHASLFDSIKNEAYRYVHDARSMTVAPFHWSRHQWGRFGEGIGAVAAAYALDRPLYRAVQRNKKPWTNDIAKYTTPFGGQRAEYISELMIVVGAIDGDHQMRDAGRDSLEAEVWAGGIVTPVIKRVAGRVRPIANRGTYIFYPFSVNQSFPSGHATNVFAFATGIAQHYDGWVVPTIVYTIATSVAFSRVHDSAHFPSDVVAGALIGRTIAKGVYWRHKNVTVSPTVIDHHAAVSVHIAL